jgi:hypothetical protein
MHEYDVALKNILTRPGSSIMMQLTGASSLRWINVEAPKVGNRRVDLLGELPDGNLVHIELQSRNEKDFPLRMAEYLFGIGRQYGRLPRQVVLYVGEAPLRMKDRIEGPDVSVRFHLVDIRDLDGERLLASSYMGDNVLAVLTRLSERPKVVRRILKRIAAGSPDERDEAFAEFLILARLRRLSGEVKRGGGENADYGRHHGSRRDWAGDPQGPPAGPCRRSDGNAAQPDSEALRASPTEGRPAHRCVKARATEAGGASLARRAAH